MTRFKLVLSSVLLTALFSLSAHAGQGALLGIDITEPNIAFQSADLVGEGTSYDAGSSALTVNSTAVFLRLVAGGGDTFIPGGDVSLTATIDNTGAFGGGSYTISDSGGELVGGTLTDYGIIDTGGVCLLDFIGTADSGSLLSNYGGAGSSIGIIFAGENCGYTAADGFNVSWTGTAKGDMGAETPPIEEFPHTIGYWKNHPEAWPVDNITICGENLDQQELLSILKSPTRGDKTLSMAKQLIAGILGGSGGACPTLTSDAEAWLCDHGGIGAGRKTWDGGEALKDALDFYNNGNGCTP